MVLDSRLSDTKRANPDSWFRNPPDLKDESPRQRYPGCYSEPLLFVPNFSIELTPHLIPQMTTHRPLGAAISPMAKDVIIREIRTESGAPTVSFIYVSGVSNYDSTAPPNNFASA
jgi:hypothetical protein